VTKINEVKWPDEVDFKGAIHGNLWHFYQISLNKTKKHKRLKNKSFKAAECIKKARNETLMTA
jgi:hypothetical protein